MHPNEPRTPSISEEPGGSNTPVVEVQTKPGSGEIQAVKNYSNVTVNQPEANVILQGPKEYQFMHEYGPSTSSSSKPHLEENEQVVTKSSEAKGCSKRKPSKGKGKAKAKKRVKYPCGVCSDECFGNAIACDGCDDWCHFECVGIDPENCPNEWYCQQCKMLE